MLPMESDNRLARRTPTIDSGIGHAAIKHEPDYVLTDQAARAPDNPIASGPASSRPWAGDVTRPELSGAAREKPVVEADMPTTERGSRPPRTPSAIKPKTRWIRRMAHEFAGKSCRALRLSGVRPG